MSNLYIFSHNNLIIKYNEKIINVNAFSQAKITNYNNEILEVIEKINNQTFSSNLILSSNQNPNLSQNIRSNIIDGNMYCEIIHTWHTLALQKFNTKSCEVFVYNNFVEILSNNKFYTYYFNGSLDCNVIEHEGIVYIFNQQKILEFDTKNNTFCLKNCKKYAKNGQNIEILCRIPQNNNFFSLYIFDTNNNSVSKKNYKNDNVLSCNKYTLPFIFFHLSKCNIDIAKTLIDNNLSYDDLKTYLCQFDDIWEIDGEYFLSSHKQICKINFEIQNNLIIDVD